MSALPGRHGERADPVTVIVADDEFAVVEVLALALEGEGHRVRKAGDRDALRRLLDEDPADVVICESAMAASLPARPARVVIVTVDPSAAPAVPHDPGVRVLAKPFVLSQLFDLVAQARRQP